MKHNSNNASLCAKLTVLLCLVLFLANSNVSAQSDKKQQIEQIRKWYYTTTAEISNYEKAVLNDTISVFFKNGLIRKITNKSTDGVFSREWFFTPSLDLGAHEKESYLYFMHEVNLQSRDQHRFYFHKFGYSGIKELIRWLLPNNSPQLTSSDEFLEKGISLAEQGDHILGETQKLLALRNENLDIRNRVLAIDLEIKDRVVEKIINEKVAEDTLEVIDESYYVLPTEKAYDTSGILLFVKTTSGMDGGHTVYQESKKWKYYDAKGKMVKLVQSEGTAYLGYSSYEGRVNFHKSLEIETSYLDELGNELFKILTKKEVIGK